MITDKDVQKLTDELVKAITEIIGNWGEKLQESIEKLHINHQEILDDHEKRITRLEEKKVN